MSAGHGRREGAPEEPSGPQVPGEHWRIDLLTWGLPVFGEPVDGHLRELFVLGGRAVLDDRAWLPDLDLLAARSHAGRATRTELDTFDHQLCELLDDVSAEVPGAALEQGRRRWWSRRRHSDG